MGLLLGEVYEDGGPLSSLRNHLEGSTDLARPSGDITQAMILGKSVPGVKSYAVILDGQAHLCALFLKRDGDS